MRTFILTLFILGTLFGANTPAKADPVMADIVTEYKAYSAALKNKDLKLARKHAKKAWEGAEIVLGDHTQTGDLAYNYASLVWRAGDMKLAIDPITRATDLAGLAKKDGALKRLRREVELASMLITMEKRHKAWKRLDEAREFAGKHKLDNSVLAGELMVLQARVSSDNANRAAHYSYDDLWSRINQSGRLKKTQSKSAQFAHSALEIFEKNPENTQDFFKATAYKLIGFSHERSKEWKEAVFAYQDAMSIQKNNYSFDDKPYITTIGRWINVRTHFIADIEMEDALAQGLCKCWPFEDETNNKAEPIKRVPPSMPSNAYTSGFSIVKFDLDDDGKVINPKLLHSWPLKLYDKPSMRTVKRWKYETKADGDKDAQRTGLVVNVRYILTDYNSGDPI